MFRLWVKRPFLISAFLLALALTLFFGFRLIHYALYWADPAHHQESVKPWMTVGYVAKSWDLDPREIDRLAGLPSPQEKGHPIPLAEIARDRGVPVAQIIADVEAAIAQLQQQRPAAP